MSKQSLLMNVHSSRTHNSPEIETRVHKLTSGWNKALQPYKAELCSCHGCMLPHQWTWKASWQVEATASQGHKLNDYIDTHCQKRQRHKGRKQWLLVAGGGEWGPTASSWRTSVEQQSIRKFNQWWWCISQWNTALMCEVYLYKHTKCLRV